MTGMLIRSMIHIIRCETTFGKIGYLYTGNAFYLLPPGIIIIIPETNLSVIIIFKLPTGKAVTDTAHIQKNIHHSAVADNI